jgi:hypothetical protein
MCYPSEDAIQELREQYPRVENLASAQRVWDRMLTPADREALGGNRAEAISEGGSIGMWIRSHGGSGYSAIAELAHRLGFASAETRDWLLKEFGEELSQTRDPMDRPVWNRECYELRFNGTVIRRITRPNVARNIVAVLDAFEENNWSSRIDDPLPGGRDQQRLHATIQSLNTGIDRIVFSADGTGAGYMWRLATS